MSIWFLVLSLYGVYTVLSRSIYKLTDFGAARALQQQDESFTSLYGTEEYLVCTVKQLIVASPDYKLL